MFFDTGHVSCTFDTLRFVTGVVWTLMQDTDKADKVGSDFQCSTWQTKSAQFNKVMSLGTQAECGTRARAAINTAGTENSDLTHDRKLPQQVS